MELVPSYKLIFPGAGRLLNEAGFYLKQHALYIEAEPLYQQALEILKEILGCEHPITQHVSHNYIAVLRKLGRDIDAQQVEADIIAKKR